MEREWAFRFFRVLVCFVLIVCLSFWGEGVVGYMVSLGLYFSLTLDLTFSFMYCLMIRFLI